MCSFRFGGIGIGIETSLIVKTTTASAEYILMFRFYSILYVGASQNMGMFTLSIVSVRAELFSHIRPKAGMDLPHGLLILF